MANQEKLSKFLKVSQGTVSRALRSNGRVSPELRERVVKAARHMGYQLPVRATPRRVRTSRSRGLICVEIVNGDAWHALLIGGAIDAAKEVGREVIVAPHRTGAIPQVVSGGQVEGLVRLMGPADYYPGGKPLEESPVPTVSILYPAPGADVVSVDAFESACDLGLHLGAMHPGIAAYLGYVDRIGHARWLGLMAGLRERGATLPMDLVRITGDINIAPSMRLVDELLDLRAAGRPEHQFTLLGCYNDFIARYAIERIRARGLRVPEDIGVAGYDDVDPAPSPGSRLTTVHLPIRELGMAAVRRLHTRLLHPGEPPLHWLLQTHVIEGNSVIRREMR